MNKKNRKCKSDNINLANLPLTEYYRNLPAAKRKVVSAPKDELLETIAKISGRAPASVRRWCLGDSMPPFHVQEKIAKHFNSTPEILFPKAV